MMFVNEDYSNYKYVVGVSDNYVILAKTSHVNASWDYPQSIPVVYQFFEPSFVNIESTKQFTTTTYFSQIDTSQSFFSRADSLDLITVQVILIFMILFFLNGLTKFVHKGGVFFGS